jgi:hypothetical protein
MNKNFGLRIYASRLPQTALKYHPLLTIKLRKL